MKAKFILILSALYVSLAIHANSVEIGGLYYILDEAKKVATVTFTNCDKTFNNGWDKTYVSIPSSVKYKETYYKVTEIGDNAFANCNTLTSITIPNSVTTIGKDAFRWCSGLTGITFPNSLKTIKTGAFMKCQNLSSITIPNNVTEIEVYAFVGCKRLTNIDVGSANNAYCSIKGVLYSKDKTTLVIYPEGREGAYVIPKNVKNIESWAFHDCKKLTSITLPNSVTYIGDGAFTGCKGLSKPVYNKHIFAYLPENYQGDYTIPAGIKQIAGRSFSDCKKLSSITIPNSVESIGHCAFDYCKELTTISIPNSVTDVGSSILRGCTSISEPIYNEHIFIYLPKSYSGAYDIPSGITQIAGAAFSGCKQLSAITIPNSIESIGSLAFDNCQLLTSVSVPNSVNDIGPNAFMDCKNLKSITLPNNLTNIEDHTFMGCENLTTLIIPDKVTSIGRCAFMGCKSLTCIIMPKNATSYGESVFLGCPATIYTTSSEKIASLPSERIVRTSHEKLKRYNRPFSSFAKEYVEKAINEWQKKGDFERTTDWQNRVNELTRQQKIEELLEEAEIDYITFWKPGKQLNLQLGKYDADNEVYALKDPQFGAVYLPVPLKEAPNFKSRWYVKKLEHQLQIKNDQFILASFTVTMPGGKSYTYRNTDAVNYNLAEIDYNFAPIELNLSSSDTQSDKQKNQMTTIRGGKSIVDTDIPTTEASNPNTFVIIFANEDYKNVASVPFAKNDGSVFQKYCQKTLGIPTSNIHYVENASYNDIRIQLAWLNDVCDAFDGNASIIVYYSGHGIPDEASKSAYLLPVDGDGRYVQSAYKVDDLYQKLGAMNTKSVTIFMDACFSGATRSNTMVAQAKGVALKAKNSIPQGRTVVFSAAQGDESAGFFEEEGHGLFTYYLLKKLQETKGDVSLQDLGEYIITNVRKQSIVNNGKSQTPCVTPSPSATDWQNWKLK